MRLLYWKKVINTLNESRFMNIIQTLRDFYRIEQFRPSILSIIINPYYFNRKAIYNGLKLFSKRLNGNLLDFGCGTKPYEDLFEVDSYTGIDLANNTGHNLSKDKVDVWYDGNKIPFNDNTFQSIYSSEVFEHVFNLKEMLSEINRVHKPNGLLLITMPFVWQEHEMPNDFGRYTTAGIKELLYKNNYVILEHLKSPGYFLSIVQLLSAYIHHSLLPKSNSLKLLFAPIIIFPINLLGVFFNFFLPINKTMFINHVILAKNIKE